MILFWQYCPDFTSLPKFFFLLFRKVLFIIYSRAKFKNITGEKKYCFFEIYLVLKLNYENRSFVIFDFFFHILLSNCTIKWFEIQKTYFIFIITTLQHILYPNIYFLFLFEVKCRNRYFFIAFLVRRYFRLFSLGVACKYHDRISKF